MPCLRRKNCHLCIFSLFGNLSITLFNLLSIRTNQFLISDWYLVVQISSTWNRFKYLSWYPVVIRYGGWLMLGVLLVDCKSQWQIKKSMVNGSICFPSLLNERCDSFNWVDWPVTKPKIHQKQKSHKTKHISNRI